MWLASLVVIIASASPQLEEGRVLVQQLQFAQARVRLEAAKASTTLSIDERREVIGLLAHCFAAEGRVPDAENVYAELLATDAKAPAPVSGPPRLRDAFRRAKERLYPPTFASLTREVAAPGRVGVQLLDPWSRCGGGVFLLRRTTEGFVAEPVTLDERGHGQADLANAAAWYVEARGPTGERCAAIGSAAEPFLNAPPIVETAAPSVVVARPRSRVVPWLVFGVAAAAAVTTGIFAGLGADSLARSKQAVFASDLRQGELAARDQFSLAWGFGAGAGLATLATVVLFVAW